MSRRDGSGNDADRMGQWESDATERRQLFSHSGPGAGSVKQNRPLALAQESVATAVYQQYTAL